MNCYLVTSSQTFKTYGKERTSERISKEYFYGENEEAIRLQFEKKNTTSVIIEIKKRDYIVLSDSRPQWLEEKVNTFLEKGWKLLGGVSVGGCGESDSDGFINYVQSLEWSSKSCN